MSFILKWNDWLKCLDCWRHHRTDVSDWRMCLKQCPRYPIQSCWIIQLCMAETIQFINHWSLIDRWKFKIERQSFYYWSNWCNGWCKGGADPRHRSVTGRSHVDVEWRTRRRRRRRRWRRRCRWRCRRRCRRGGTSLGKSPLSIASEQPPQPDQHWRQNQVS